MDKIKKINLFTEYYQDDDLDRQLELEYCILENIKNQYINDIYLFINTKEVKTILSYIKESDKIHFIKTKSRLTYNMFFKQTQNYPNNINILCNTDIFFDDSIQIVYKMTKKSAYGLLRYNIIDDYKSELYGPFDFSQDVWIFNGNIKPMKDADINLGIMGCDGRIAKVLLNNKIKLTNPSNKIITHHLHLTDKRNYDKTYLPYEIEGYKARIPLIEPLNLFSTNNFKKEYLLSLKYNRELEKI